MASSASLREVGRGRTRDKCPSSGRHRLSRSRPIIGMTTCTCENGCAPFYVPLSF